MKSRHSFTDVAIFVRIKATGVIDHMEQKTKIRFIVLTLFPKMLQGFFSESIVARAKKSGKIEVKTYNLRDWGVGKWKKVDDTPYGGGSGMILRADVVASAIKAIKSEYEGSDKGTLARKHKLKVILMTPQGEKYTQKKARQLSKGNNDLLLICGHYEGFDERVREYVDEEISVGDYILTGGELAAAIVVDSVSRLIPGVLGNKKSHQEESFSCFLERDKKARLLEYPQYTRPDEYEGKRVPEVLKSGNHQLIEKWRAKESIKKTKKRRPDLI